MVYLTINQYSIGSGNGLMPSGNKPLPEALKPSPETMVSMIHVPGPRWVQQAHILVKISWWCYQMETFSVLLSLCEGNPPVTGGLPSQRPMTRSFDVSFNLRQKKRLSKQSRRRWFETPSSSLWRYCNVNEFQWQSFAQYKQG